MKQPSFWARIFLLATSFRYECAELTLDEVAQRIEALDRPKETFFASKSMLTFVSPITWHQAAFPFKMVTLLSTQGGWQETTELRGILYRHPSRNTIVAEGRVQTKQVLGWIFVSAALLGGSLAVIAFAIMITWWHRDFRYLLLLLFLILFGGVFSHLLRQSMEERTQLLATLHDSMTVPQLVKSKMKRSLLEGGVETTRLVDLETNAPAEKRKRDNDQ